MLILNSCFESVCLY